MNEQKNSTGGIISFILIIIGILILFGTDQIFVGIGLFCIGFVIIMLKMMWGISGWADDTLHRWTEKNLSPREDFDTASEHEGEDPK